MKAKIVAFARSERFFHGVIGLFVFQALWIALSGHYPLAFDEDFHFGIIRLYANHLSPFWSAQPPNADVFGAVFRDPSYLYQYLMSFPYRLISIFTHDTTIQVICLRLIDIALFAAGLVLYRRVLYRLGATRAMGNIILLLFVLIPIVPFLAGQVNYDNLFLPLSAAFLILTLDVYEDIRNIRPLRAGRLGLLVSTGLLASLVKYPFLPIFFAAGMFLIIEAYRHLGRRHKFWRSLGFGVSALRRPQQILLALLVLISLGLFSERYVINIVHYHQLVPACGRVLGTERCKAYGPWARDYNFSLVKSDLHDGPLAYSGDWFYGVWFRSFFAVDGPATNFETRGPLVMPAIAAVVFASVGLLALLVTLPRLIKKHDMAAIGLAASLTAVYLLVLWLDNYQAYLRTGQPVAISGRYLLVIYPFIMLFMALGYRQALAGREKLQIALACVAVGCFLWGGGALTYILRSRDEWLWPNPLVTHINYDARQWLSPLVPGSQDPIEFLP